MSPLPGQFIEKEGEERMAETLSGKVPGKDGLRVVGVIPVRLESARLPGKPLRDVAGEPLLFRVWHAAAQYSGWDDLVVATENPELVDFCRQRSIPVLPTGPHPSGTDRLFEVAERVPADVYVNIQGDEPTLLPEHFVTLLQPILRGEAPVSTLRVPLAAELVENRNMVKVVVGLGDRALYFSRLPIPFHRDSSGVGTWHKHIGIYAFRRAALLWFRRLPPGRLEKAERLEQLRFLENGIPIAVPLTLKDTIGVDTEDDLERAVQWFRNRNEAVDGFLSP